MNVEFINPFLVSLTNVLETMAHIQIQPAKPSLKNDDCARGAVSGVIGMVGPQCKGSMSITFDAELAYEVMYRMVGERPKCMNDEVTDMVGEITNMVTGGAKRILAEKGYEFGMATPTVVSGLSHKIIHQSKGPKLVMPFNSSWGKAHIEICFEMQADESAAAAATQQPAG